MSWAIDWAHDSTTGDSECFDTVQRGATGVVSGIGGVMVGETVTINLDAQAVKQA